MMQYFIAILTIIILIWQTINHNDKSCLFWLVYNINNSYLQTKENIHNVDPYLQVNIFI